MKKCIANCDREALKSASVCGFHINHPSDEKAPRTDYKQLAKEFKVIRLGKHGIKLFPKDPSGHIYKLVQITPLTGWITDDKEIERIVRKNGMEL